MKRIRKLLSLALVLAMTAVLLSACGGNNAGNNGGGSGNAGGGDAGGEKSAADYKIVLILPGEVNDQGWNASNYAGLLTCNEELGTNMEYVENVQSADFESTFREYCERGYDIIMAAGSQFDEAAVTVAASYPNTRFMIVNGANAELENLSPLFPKEYEASYLAAIVAGSITETGKFAMIGGESNQAMENLMAVYGKTAVAIAQERGISDASYNLAYANSWSDIALGKQMGESMIDEGADVVFAYANELGLGAIDAAISKGVYVVGYSSDQTVIDPNVVVASVDFDFSTMYKWAIESYMKGELAGGTLHEVGIAEDIFVPIYTENITQEVKDRVDAAIEEYKAGGVDLTALFDE